MAYFYVYNARSKVRIIIVIDSATYLLTISSPDSKVRVVVFFSALWVGQGVGFFAPLVSWVLCTAPSRQGTFVQFMLSG